MNRKKVDFDSYVSDYNQLLAKQTGFFSPSEQYFASYKADVARRLMGDRPRFVHEFGCGIGRNLAFLARAFPKATLSASDISEASVERARIENPGVECWVEGRGALRQEKFDLVFVAGVYHHVPVAERTSVSESLLARLRPGGELLVFEHNPFNPITRRIVGNCPYDEDAILLTPGELQRHLTHAGFETLRTGYALFVPPRLKALCGLERWLEWLPLGGQYWVWAARPSNE